MDVDAADPHREYARNGKVMLGSAVLLFLIVLIIVFFHTYGLSCFRRRRRHHRRTLRFSRTSSTTIATRSTTYDKGLDPSLLKFLPTFIYSSATHRPLQECAVCLSEFEDGDEGRLLPNCNHPFHSLCIDTWFDSHCNCPLCRAPVQPYKISSVSACSNSEPLFLEAQMEKGEVGCSSLPPPIGCPRKPLEVVGLGMVGVIVELPVEEEERLSGSEWIGSAEAGDSGLKGSDNRIMSLGRIWSV